MPRAKRETRNAETREATQHQMPQTRFHGALALPEDVLRDGKRRGVVFRWIAMAVNNQPHPNAMNVQGRLMNGWKPVMAEQYPAMSELVLPGQQQSAMIVRGGLVLCEIPIKMYREERAALDQENREVMQQIKYADIPDQPGNPGLGLTSDVRGGGIQTGIERVASREREAAFKE